MSKLKDIGGSSLAVLAILAIIGYIIYLRGKELPLMPPRGDFP